jgi:elongation factor G
VQWPIGREGEFRGIVDLVERKAFEFDEDSLGRTVVEIPIPPEVEAEVEAARSRLVERAAEQEEALTDKYLAGEVLTVEEIRRALRRGTLSRAVTPVHFGAALRNKGVQLLLDSVIHYLPSPLESGVVKGRNPKTDGEERREPDPGASLCALAFKTVADRHGDLTFVRVYSGTMASGSQFYNPRAERVERANRILLMHANDRVQLEMARAGDIVALVGLRYTVTGDTLCTKHDPIVLEAMEFPETVISMAIEPKSTADRDKLMDSLGKMAKDDPTFRTREDEDTGQIIISGMGELHLEVIAHQLEREYKVRANIGKPRVAYRQTIGDAVEAEGVFDRETGGKRQFGRVVLEVRRLPNERKLLFRDATAERSVPKPLVAAVRSGVVSSAEGGVGYGYPVVQLGVTLKEATVEPDASTEAAFEAATVQAMRDAFERAGSILLEPVMRVEVTTPENYLGDVIGDLNGRRTEITEVETRGELRIVKGRVPLARMFGYSSTLRSATQGRATYSMEPHSYAPVPPEIAARFTF